MSKEHVDMSAHTLNKIIGHDITKKFCHENTCKCAFKGNNVRDIHICQLVRAQP